MYDIRNTSQVRKTHQTLQRMIFKRFLVIFSNSYEDKARYVAQKDNRTDVYQQQNLNGTRNSGRKAADWMGRRAGWRVAWSRDKEGRVERRVERVAESNSREYVEKVSVE